MAQIDKLDPRRDPPSPPSLGERRPVIDGDVELLDERFAACVTTSARVERLAAGCRWAEGPASFPAGRSLVWSDVPNGRVLRWDAATGVTGVFRRPAGSANGHTVDRQGRLVSREHGHRRLTRTEPDGAVTVVADRFGGKRFNSPNDVVAKADGSVGFTDPAYGIDPDDEGHKAQRAIGACRVSRVDPATGACRIVADDVARPNGLAFSPDERRLYVSDTHRPGPPGGPPHLRVFAVGADGTLSGGGVFAVPTAGAFDGVRLDDAGRVWTSAGDGVHGYDPDGTLLGKVRLPERVANVVFGGPKRNRLFVCATTSLYSVLLPVNGAKTF